MIRGNILCMKIFCLAENTKNMYIQEVDFDFTFFKQNIQKKIAFLISVGYKAHNKVK